MVTVGDKVQFVPSECVTGIDIRCRRIEATGEIVDVNHKHKWFSVEYGESKMRTSFKFCDIGSVVKIVGRR